MLFVYILQNLVPDKMAEAPDTYEKGVEELGEEITCPVCQDHFREPKILPCLHYYCKECVRQLALRQHPFPCPECRSNTVLPQNDPDQLPTAFFVNRMKELHTKMEKAEGKVEVVCEMCSKSKAEAFCRNCMDFICTDCMTLHKRLKVFAGHQVVTLEELKMGGAKQIPLKEAPPMLCKDHDEQLKIFCFDCNRLICQHCVIYGHSNHKHEHIKTSAPQCRKMLTESLVPLKKAQSDIGGASKSVEATEAEISAQCVSVSNAIQQSFDQIMELLRQRKQQLLKDAAKLKDEKLDALKAQRKNFQVAQTEAQSLVEFVERSLENATDEELMSIHKQVLTRVEEGCKRCGQLDLEPTTGPNIAVDVSYGESIPLNVGSVYLAIPDPSKCTVQGTGIKSSQVGKPSQFTVHVVTCQKQPVTHQKVVAELTSLVDTSVVQVKVIEKDKGDVYEATYTPKIRGRHTLTIRVNGREIAGSPFQVFVKIHPTQLGKPVRTISGISGYGIAFSNKQQELFVCDRDRNCIAVINTCGKEVRTIAHDNMTSPHGVAVDKDESVYVTERDTGSVLKFNRDGRLVKICGGLQNPLSVAVADNRVFVSEDEGLVHILDRDLIGKSRQTLSSGNGQFTYPRGVVQAGAELFVADAGNNRIQVFDLKGHFVRTFGNKGTIVQWPLGLCFDPSSEFLYVTEHDNGCVSMFRPGGEFVASCGKMAPPHGIAIDDDGFVYVCTTKDIVVL